MNRIITFAGLALAALTLTVAPARAACNPECGDGETCRYHAEKDTYTCEPVAQGGDFKPKVGSKIGGKMDPASPNRKKGGRTPGEGIVGK